METAPRGATPSPDPRFRYVAGDPGLDLVNTVVWTEAGLLHERLTDYAALLRWAEGAGVVTRARARRLRALAMTDPASADRAHEEALRLRWTLRRVYGAGEQTPVAALEELNARVGEALAHRRLGRRRGASRQAGALEWEWIGGDEDLEAPLWPVALGAADLLASPEAHRVRLCAGDECGWMYVDRSRNGLRRWCEMETCGTAAKTRRRAARRAAGSQGRAMRKGRGR